MDVVGGGGRVLSQGFKRPYYFIFLLVLQVQLDRHLSNWRTKKKPCDHYVLLLSLLRRKARCPVDWHGHSGPWPVRIFPSEPSHLRRKALLNLSKSSIPSPPKFSGLVTKGHPTLHFPPEISLSPAQRKRCLALSKSTNSCLGALRDVRR